MSFYEQNNNLRNHAANFEIFRKNISHAKYFAKYSKPWSHPLMIVLHCLWAKSNNRTRGQFECEVTWFCFCFDFDCSHARCGCCSIICLRYQVVQIKQVDSKMSTKLGLCFLLIDWLSFRERGGSFEIGRPRSRGWKNIGRRWTKGVGGPGNLTIFIDVICVSSHILSIEMIVFII